MVGRVRVLRGVLVRRGVAAADLPARHAHAQVDSPGADRETILTTRNVLGQVDDLDPIGVGADRAHPVSLEARRGLARVCDPARIVREVRRSLNDASLSQLGLQVRRPTFHERAGRSPSDLTRRSILLTRKLWLSTALVAVALLAVFAGSGAAKSAKAGAQGGTMNIDLPNDVDYTDPALDYLSTGWEIEYATCLKLMNYPDANGAKGSQLVPEAATGFPKVSNSGKTYDFNVKVGYTKFSNGQAVTAANFKAAFDRNADPKMQSPAVAFFSDIVGSDKSPVSGVKVRGSHLTITLTHASPDFLARVAMPFFCAIPTNLPHDPNGVLAPASAGPYYISDRVPNKSITLKKNPYYKGKRPHNVNQIEYTIGNALPATYLRVQQGASDYAAAGIPPAAYSEAASKYGINKGQFWVKPQLGVQYIAMNHDRPLFKGAKGTALAKAINYAIDRKAMLAPGRLPRGQAHRPGPASGHCGLPRRVPLSAQGAGPGDGQEVGREGRAEVGPDARVLHLEHGLGAAGGSDPAVQPQADRDQRQHARVRTRGSDRERRDAW